MDLTQQQATEYQATEYLQHLHDLEILLRETQERLTSLTQEELELDNGGCQELLAPQRKKNGIFALIFEYAFLGAIIGFTLGLILALAFHWAFLWVPCSALGLLTGGISSFIAERIHLKKEKEEISRKNERILWHNRQIDLSRRKREILERDIKRLLVLKGRSLKTREQYYAKGAAAGLAAPATDTRGQEKSIQLTDTSAIPENQGFSIKEADIEGLEERQRVLEEWLILWGARMN